MTTIFRNNAAQAIRQEDIRINLNRVVGRLRQHRHDAFPDPAEFEQLRRQCKRIRERAVNRLPELLEILEANLKRNGIQVHWAETTLQANQIVLDIMQRHQAKMLIKGKSMVSEEMEINAYLASHGIECIESDLGEFIIQLANEKPAHIIVPAIHKNRKQIAALMHSHFPEMPYSEDIDNLAAMARHFLRDKFCHAPVGMTGVNFMVAETGTLCLVENEGNGRMCTTVPPVHIAVTGIEKVIEKLDDLPPLLTMLVRSATGQPITTYVNMISSPRKSGEKDGPEAVHLVLLDNGRSSICGDTELMETLHCIRCGACINHCPVYRQIGGHAYGTVIPGPIGSILEPQKGGLANYGELAQASTLCGSCSAVCPVNIPIPKIINRLRWEANRHDFSHMPGAGAGRKPLEALSWKIWQRVCIRPGLYRRITKLVSCFRNFIPTGVWGGWKQIRKAPRPARATLHERLKAMNVAAGDDHD